VQVLRPTTIAELAHALRDAAGSKQKFALAGGGSKARMGGPAPETGFGIVTTGLDRLIEYEPRDLTISVEAGMPWRTLCAITAERGQMAPLDPALAETATVGGVVAAGMSGPRRRLYGSVRDQVIGMECVTLDGEMIQSGGMVVKNVAGYDLQKLMIGSFGTLAALASVNFKLAPIPPGSATFALAYDTLEDAATARNSVLTGALQPSALDLLNPAAAAAAGLVEAWVLLVRAGGSARVLGRYERELPGASRLDGEAESRLWTWVGDFAPASVAVAPAAVVIRAAFPLQALAPVMALAPGAAVARAGNGLAWLACPDAASAMALLKPLAETGASTILEWTGAGAPATLQRWPEPGPALELMRDLKKLFDPQGLMNPGRLHGRI
jgi:glycolate oxidase FAD binding subunit